MVEKCSDCGYPEWCHDHSADAALAQVCWEFQRDSENGGIINASK